MYPKTRKLKRTICQYFIAAAILSVRSRFALHQVPARLSAGQPVGRVAAGTSMPVSSALQRGGSRAGKPGRPSKYHHMAKVKTRLEFNSMGERVVVQTALHSIDAFATRSRYCSHPTNQRQEQRQRMPQQPTFDGDASDHGEATDSKFLNAAGDGAAHAQAAADEFVAVKTTWDPQDGSSSGWGDTGPGSEEGRLDEGGGRAPGGRRATSWTPATQTVSKSLGFGLPDFSMVCSRVGLRRALAV